jgi:hypothetical protein
MNSYLYRILKKSRILPQKWFVRLHYRYQTGKTLNLDDPREFSEKIQWLKIYYKPPILTRLVDKYEVRSYVSERVGEKYLNEVYGVYERPGDIDFSGLPRRFVLKATHGYDMNLVVRDKGKLDVARTQETTKKWLAINHYYRAGMEWAYKDVRPRLIAERFMEEKGREDISDYKFFCFDGVPRFLQLDLDRGHDHSVRYYDMQWERLPFVLRGSPRAEGDIAGPENFGEMVDVVRKLSAGFPFVRVDLYNLDGKIIFGEMTFYPGDGRAQLEPERYNTILGDYIKLPQVPKGKKFITCQ